MKRRFEQSSPGVFIDLRRVGTRLNHKDSSRVAGAAKIAIQDILNFIRIDDLTASAGQPTEPQFREAQAAGYDLVINLAPDGLATSLPDEGQLLASLGVEYHHIPVPWANPSLAQLDEFIAVMKHAAGRRKLIHCQANYRVTAFYALYAMAALGWDRRQADALIARVWTARPGAMDETWRRFIDAAANGAATRREFGKGRSFEIREDDLSGEQTIALLALHLAGMQAYSPPGSVHALDVSGLKTPDVTVWTAWRDHEIAAIGALKTLADGNAEVKSMRTHPDFLRMGAGAAILETAIAAATARGARRLSLETGSGAAFDPALALYRRRGFGQGDAFGEYQSTDFNQFLHLELAAPTPASAPR